jgi:hypothetical protein
MQYMVDAQLHVCLRAQGGVLNLIGLGLGDEKDITVKVIDDLPTYI